MTAVQVQPRINLKALQFDFIFLAIALALTVIGLIMVFSVTFAPNVGQGRLDPEWDFVKQGVFALLGIAIALVMMRVDYHFWGRLSVPLFVVTLILLVALLFMPETNGARRWLFGDTFGSSIQPGEIAKFTVIVYMARWLSSKGEQLRDVTYGLLPFAIFVGIVTGLVVLQPNLSTAITIAMCAMAMFFIAGADLVQFLFMLGVGGGTVAVVIAKTPYLLQRWIVFTMDPLSLSAKEGYQVLQSLIALGSGGLFGRGIGASLFKFGHLPLANNDAIFAILGEEMGLIGTWLVLALFLGLAYRGFRIASKAADPFGQVLAAGLTFWLVIQAFVNIAVVTDSIPYSGVPLPFISYGGSALVSVFAAVGVLLNISRSSANDRAITKEEDASIDLGRRDRGTRVSRPGGRRRTTETSQRARE